jgi:hypothetical protein
VLSGEANATAKTHDGPVKALRTLKVLQRSAAKASTQVLNQLPALLVTASDDLRARLRDLSQRELLQTCAGPASPPTMTPWRRSTAAPCVSLPSVSSTSTTS